VLITGHHTQNCIKLMHNKEVFYPHFPFCILSLHNKAGNVHITQHWGAFMQSLFQEKSKNTAYSESVCL
jgi:hypothetical protein